MSQITKELIALLPEGVDINSPASLGIAAFNLLSGPDAPDGLKAKLIQSVKGALSNGFNLEAENRALAAEIRKLKLELYTDSVTQGNNRRSFIRRMEDAIKEIEQDPSISYTLGFFDLDGFKAVNDKFGHEDGDEALIDVDRALNNVITQDDMIARLGGDEIVGFFKHSEGRDLSVERIKLVTRQNLKGMGFWDTQTMPPTPYPIGASIGTAVLNAVFIQEHGAKGAIDALLKIADQAMYADKAGKPVRLEQVRVSMLVALREENPEAFPEEDPENFRL